MHHKPTAEEPWVDPRDVESGVAGTLFCVQINDVLSGPIYQLRFMRVRVVMGQMNMEDVASVAAYARKLLNNKQPFISFAAGRDTPYPEYPGDAAELMRDARAMNDKIGGRKLN